MFNRSKIAALTVSLGCVGFVTYKVVKYLRSRERELNAKQIIREVGTHNDELDEQLNAFHGSQQVAPAGIAQLAARKVRVRPQHARLMAYSVASEAYFKFGRRVRNEANDLVTRKFMRDLLQGYPDLRVTDKNTIIEMALAFSYIPPSISEEVDDFVGTDAYAAKVTMDASIPRV